MMKAIKFLLYFLLGLAVLIGLLGLFAKKTYHIERSIDIDAPKALVFDQVRLFKNFHEWSPWSQLDSNMKLTYTGEDGTPGASYAWKGNDDVGEGKQTLKQIGADRIDLELQFVEPFETTTPVFFNVTGDSLKTKVTWGFDPVFPFPINVWAMFTDIDKAMGADYERGLGYLKRRCESIAHKKYNGFEISEVDLPQSNYLIIRKVVPIAEVTAFFAENLPKILSATSQEKLTPSGAPVGLYWTYDAQAGNTDMAAGIPVKEDRKPAKPLQALQLGGTRALVIDYLGNYDKIEAAHNAMELYMKEYHLAHVPPAIESYVTDPGSEPDTAKWLTKVIYLVKPAQDTTDSE